MPDLRPVEQFATQMEQLEARYLREIGQLLKEARLILLEALIRGPAGLAATARREFDALSRQVASIASAFGAPLEEAALNLADKQFDLVARVFAQTDFSQAQQATAGRRQAILAGFGQNATAWPTMFQAQFLVELARLRQADEALEAIADRLLAEGIASGRASVWRHGTNLAAAESQRGLWTTATAITGTLYQAGQSQMASSGHSAGQRWQKQAIAALAQNTTDCCLRVHGQTQELDQPFILVGTPRYADEIQSPPFHDFCRTGQSLYLVQFETMGVTTDEMRSAAQAELTAREDSSRKVIQPAHATSRRS